MTATIGGAADFQTPVGESLQLLVAQPINFGLPSSFDLTPQSLPNVQGLLFVWQADVTQVGNGILIDVTVGSALRIQPTTLIPDQGQVIVPLPLGIVTGVTGSTCLVGTTRVTGAPSPLIGTLFVFGMMSNPVALTSTRLSLIGRGNTTGAVAVANAATTTVLAAPASGTYYRIRAVSVVPAVAPTSTFRWDLQRLTDHLSVLSGTITATLSGNVPFGVDLENETGLELHNLSSVILNCVIAYELWAV